MKKEHHNTSLTCEALNSAESVPQSTRIHLMVEFAPNVSLERQPLVIREGDTAIFRCRAEANPELVTYKWFLGAEEMFGSEDGSVLVLPGLNRTKDGEIVKCQVSNSIGKSEETHSLDIFCKFRELVVTAFIYSSVLKTMKLLEAIHGQSLLSSVPAKVAIFMKCNTEQMLSKVKQSQRSNARRKISSNLNCILKSSVDVFRQSRVPRNP